MRATIASLVVLVALVAAMSDAKSARPPHLRHVDVGYCNKKISAKQDFEVQKYLGKWFEIQRFDYVYEEGVVCAEGIFSETNDDGVISVTMRGRNAEGGVNIRVGNGTMTEPGIMMVQFEGQPLSEYKVIDTDYETFSVVYSCDQVQELRFQYSWILSRNTTMDADTLARAHKALEDYGVDVTLFHDTPQGGDCPYQ